MKFSRRNFIKTGLIWVPSAALLKARAQVPPQVIADWQLAAQTAPPAVSYLLEENFNGSGTPTGWTAGGTAPPDFDYTATVLEGTESMRLVVAAQSGNALTPTFSNSSTFELYFLLRPLAIPGTTATFLNVRNSTTNVVTLFLTATGTVPVRCGSTGSSTPVSTMSNGTTYHVWVRYVAGSGADGFASVAFSTDGTRPTSGNNYAQQTNGNATAAANNVYFGNSGLVTYDLLFDKLRGAAATIGDNPS